MPQANTPGMLVSKLSLTVGPLVTGESSTPTALESSFSGIRPTDSSRVSQGMCSSVPGMGLDLSSTWAMVTPVTRSLPWMSTTVWLSFRGMP